MNELHLYWCGWNVPFGLPLDDLAEKWHPRMTGWCTGESDTYATYTGAVWATSPDAAMAIVRSNYGKHAARIDERWEPEVKPDDFDPGDRFDKSRIPWKPEDGEST